MIINSDWHEATFYVQVQAEWLSYSGSRVRRIKAVTVHQNRPQQPRGGAVVVKLAVRIPDAVFQPLQTEPVIIEPEARVIEVEAVS